MLATLKRLPFLLILQGIGAAAMFVPGIHAWYNNYPHTARSFLYSGALFTVVFILLFIGSFNWFELPYIMAGLEGSPYGSTDVLGLVFYRAAFGNVAAGGQDFGIGSALAVLMFLFIGVVATFWTLYLRKRELEV